jgi:2,3-dihydroxyphenylpropionate 1,2-dioxygenase
MNTQLICASHSPLLYCYKKEPEKWQQLQESFKAQAEAIRIFDPELVIAFGSDHFNGFFLKMMPSFCVGFQADAVGDIGGFEGRLDVPEDLARDLAFDLRNQRQKRCQRLRHTRHIFLRKIKFRIHPSGNAI